MSASEPPPATSIQPHGVQIVDKPKGPTSHDIVSGTRRALRTRRVGHAGTLDPLATGVLVVLVGEATKLSAHLTLDDKRYRTTIALGEETDSFDAEGSVVRRVDVVDISDERLASGLQAERERTQQVPPNVSAVKVDGERAYRLARRGETPELAPRSVRVKELKLLSRTPESVTVEVLVTKGYFIRALARDLGAALDIPAHVSDLRRLSSGPFTLAEAQPWPLAAPPAPPTRQPKLIDVSDAACRCLPRQILTTDGVLRARQGKLLSVEHFAELFAPPEKLEAGTSEERPIVIAWLNANGEIVALGEESAPGEFRVVRGFNLAG